MTKIFIKKQKSGLFYGEGAKDRKFLEALISYDKFQHHTKSWHFNCDNASGSDPKVILDQCRRAVSGVEYDIVLCFIDLDKLKRKNQKLGKWKKKS